MSTYRKIPLTVNIDTGYLIDPLDGARISNEKLPAFCYGETAILCLSFVDSELNAFSFNSDDLFEFAMDSDFVHETDGAEDPLMAYSANDMADISGDWVSINRNNGNISIRIDCFTEGFLTKIDNDEEMDVWFEVKRYISGSSYPSEILRDKGYARNVLKTTEGTPASADPEYYNAVQTDSLLSTKADISHTHDTYLMKTSNLSDLSDASTSRTNLGLGNVQDLDQTNASNISSGILGAAYLPAALTSAKGAIQLESSGDITKFLNGGGSWAVPSGSGTVLNHISQGRLTLSTGVPVTTSDVTAASTLYFTPYNGNKVSLYYNSAWLITSFSETSLSISSLTASTNYDIFGYYTGSALALEALAWTDATTRATALTTQDGIYVKSGDATRCYLGTIRMTATTGQCADAGAAGPIKRFVWNMYNRVRSRNISYDSTNSWTYASTTNRIRNANETAAKHEFVFGLTDASLVSAEYHCLGVAGSAQPWLSIGFNSTTPEVGTKTGRAFSSSTAPNSQFTTGHAILGAGYGYAAALECASSAATTTFYGGASLPFITEMER
ncbi:MAG: hypothetical protein A2017_20845 [Lentisphaerae bacterium GWF2_44_16]|nr:MAG: hypothetical protein A2017_20845 [Lentisphaerae bacterium GWF2_44_16]